MLQAPNFLKLPTEMQLLIASLLHSRDLSDFILNNKRPDAFHLPADKRQAIETLNRFLTIARLASHTTEEQLTEIITGIFGKLNDNNEDIRNAAIFALGTLTYHATDTQRADILTALHGKLNDDKEKVRKAAASALSTLFPFATKIQQAKILIIAKKHNLNLLYLQLITKAYQHNKNIHDKNNQQQQNFLPSWTQRGNTFQKVDESESQQTEKCSFIN